MKLLQYKDYSVTISEEAFLVKPIRVLFDKDKTKNKEHFMQQMSYLYFMIDPRSDYSYIVNPEERSKQIILQEGLPEDFKPSKELQLAMNTYKDLVVTQSSKLLEDTRVAIDKVRDFLRNVDLTLLDDKGKPVYTINSITQAIKQIPQLSKDLMETERIVAKEIEESGRARGGNEQKALFEDGIQL